MKIPRLLCLVGLSMLLSACLNSVLPKSGDAMFYALPDADAQLRAQRPLPGPLLVELPRALPPLDRQELVVLSESGEVRLLSGARWIAPVPGLLQDLLTRQLEASGSAPSVAQSAQAYLLPLRLASELRAFELRETAGGLRAFAALSVHLVCASNARVLASSNTIDASIETGSDPQAAVTALRALSSTLATALVRWLDQVDTGNCVEPPPG